MPLKLKFIKNEQRLKIYNSGMNTDRNVFVTSKNRIDYNLTEYVCLILEYFNPNEWKMFYFFQFEQKLE